MALPAAPLNPALRSLSNADVPDTVSTQALPVPTSAAEANVPDEVSTPSKKHLRRRYRTFAEKHPLLNKGLLVGGASLVVIAAPALIRSAVTTGLRLARAAVGAQAKETAVDAVLHRLTPHSWQQAALAVIGSAGVLGLFATIGDRVQETYVDKRRVRTVYVDPTEITEKAAKKAAKEAEKIAKKEQKLADKKAKKQAAEQHKQAKLTQQSVSSQQGPPPHSALSPFLIQYGAAPSSKSVESLAASSLHTAQ